jgi:hypothetical protein
MLGWFMLVLLRLLWPGKVLSDSPLSFMNSFCRNTAKLSLLLYGRIESGTLAKNYREPPLRGVPFA